MMQPATMWSSRNRSKMLLTARQYTQLAVTVLFAMQAITMADAQNSAISSTTPKLVNGALAAAASPLSNCSNVRHLFESQGINGADIPTQPITGKFQPISIVQFDSVISMRNGKINEISYFKTAMHLNGNSKILLCAVQICVYFRSNG